MLLSRFWYLFLSLVVGSIGQEILKRYAGFSGSATTARLIAILVSALGLFVFLTTAYYVLTNVDLTVRATTVRDFVVGVAIQYSEGRPVVTPDNTAPL